MTTISNLELAWRRIRAGTNVSYKRFFRDLYDAYEIGLQDNLKDLQKRLRGFAFSPYAPVRIYVPKPSGLQRPIALLTIEDQIVYQAMANIMARRVEKKRKKFEGKSVFSNWLNKSSDIFFFVPWKHTFPLYNDKLKDLLGRGFAWYATFDLSSYYDTISHDLLVKSAFPRMGGAETTFRDLIFKFLSCWCSEINSQTPRHGIPQGPIASNFFGECLLLEIDRKMSASYKYVRYVDDIRLFGKTEEEVRRALIALEIFCRESGLVPQGSKVHVRKAQSADEVSNMLPSLPNELEEEPESTIANSQALKLFKASINGKPQRIVDKTKAKYVLFRAAPSPRLLTYVLRLLPRHPEYIDAFMVFLSQYPYSTDVWKSCRSYLEQTPYEYVQGELWHQLARMVKLTPSVALIKRARKVVRVSKYPLASKWGAYHFICKLEEVTGNAYLGYLNRESDLLKGLLGPVIPIAHFKGKNSLAKQLLESPGPEASLGLTARLVSTRSSLRGLGVEKRKIPKQTKNVLKRLGMMSQTGLVDPMGEILHRRFNMKWGKWKSLLGNDYSHALSYLGQCDPLFDSARSRWLQYQNSFNQILFVSFQNFLSSNHLPGAISLVDRNGDDKKYGTMLQSGQPFDRAHPIVAQGLRAVNRRRNSLPPSHPYDQQIGTKSKHLSVKERNSLYNGIKSALDEVIHICDPLL
ncbi:MAG: reverse transcriptase domain-containing protein [Candidatus Kapaibacterium sp.]